MEGDDLEAGEFEEEADESEEQALRGEANVTAAAPCIRRLLEEVHREEAGQSDDEE